ncbi:MAG: hypothetical protein AB2693_30475 [Candidatus Thiodiazotropha sp.]
MAKELVGDPLNGDLYLGYLWVVKSLSVAGKGSLRSHFLKWEENALHAAGGYVQVDVPEGIRLVSADFPVAQ